MATNEQVNVTTDNDLQKAQAQAIAAGKRLHATTLKMPPKPQPVSRT